MYMCDRLTEQRKAIQIYLKRREREVRVLDLTEDEWDLIATFGSLLKPIEEVSKMFCEDSSPISMQFPLARMIHSALSGSEIPNELTDVRDQMLEVLAEKFFDLPKHK